MKARAAAAACALAALTFQQVPAAPAPAVVLLAARTIDGAEEYRDALVVIAGTVHVSGSLLLHETEVVMLGDARLRVTGEAAIEASTVDGPGVVSATGALTLEDVEARRVRIEADDARVAMTDVTLTDPPGMGVRAVGSTVEVTRASISNALGYAIAVDGGSLTARTLRIDQPADYGVLAEGADVSIIDADVRGHCGIYLGDDTTGEVRDSAFLTEAHGLTLYEAGAVALRDLSFAGSAVGLGAYGSTIDARGITSTVSWIGILAVDASGEIVGGRLSGDVGIDVDGRSGLTPIVRDLDLADASVGVRSHAPATVDARWNFWGGEPGTDGAAGVAGDVSVAPWLTAAPA